MLTQASSLQACTRPYEIDQHIPPLDNEHQHSLASADRRRSNTGCRRAQSLLLLVLASLHMRQSKSIVHELHVLEQAVALTFGEAARIHICRDLTANLGIMLHFIDFEPVG